MPFHGQAAAVSRTFAKLTERLSWKASTRDTRHRVAVSPTSKALRSSQSETLIWTELYLAEPVVRFRGLEVALGGKSMTENLIDVETHREVFTWVLPLLWSAPRKGC